MSLAFCTPRSYASVHASALHELFLGLVKDSLNEEQYMASTAKLESYMSIPSDRFEIKLMGVNEKLSLLLSRLLRGVLNLDVRTKRGIPVLLYFTSVCAP